MNGCLFMATKNKTESAGFKVVMDINSGRPGVAKDYFHPFFFPAFY
jgi:hypothetical protein